MKTNKLIKFFAFATFVLGGAHVVAQNNPEILVSGTDFSAPGLETSTYVGLDKIEDNYLGIIKPVITTPLKLTPDADVDAKKKKGTFVDGMYYAITNNPAKLDSFRLHDTNESDWGIMLPKCPNPTNGKNTNLLSFLVKGLIPGGSYRVEVDYCFMADFSKKWEYGYPGLTLDNGKVNYGGIDPKILFVVNADGEQNFLNGATVGIKNREQNGCETWKSTPGSDQSGKTIDNNGSLKLNINGSGQTAGVFVKAIRVYAKLTPKITGSTSVCVGGEKGLVSVNGVYAGATYQWYRDGVKLTGETGRSVAHVSCLNKEDAKAHEYYYEMTVPDGKGNKVVLTSPVHIVKDKVCCENNSGQATSQKLIWQNNFGTFDADGEHFYILDYSNIYEPEKKFYTTKTPFKYCLPNVGIDSPEDADKCVDYGGAGIAGGGHAVCSYIAWNYGSKLGWAAMCGDGTHYGEGSPDDFFPDHSNQFPNNDKEDGGKERYGACLFVNASGGDHRNNPLVVYRQVIPQLCDHTNLSVKCWINTYSDSPNPVRMKVRVFETDNPSNFKESDKIVEKESTSSAEWQEVSVEGFNLETNSLTFEILDYANNVGDTGDDLLLDDIRVYACSAPQVTSYFDTNYKVDTVTCDGKGISQFVDLTPMLVNFYDPDHLNKLGFLFQYNVTDPSDKAFKKSWVNLTNSAQLIEDYDEAFVESKGLYEDVVKKVKAANPDQKYIYFRVVAGVANSINDEIAGSNYFNEDNPCSDISIQLEPIKLEIKCEQCYTPSKVEFGVKEGLSNLSTKELVLCVNDELTFNPVVEATDKENKSYDGYYLFWKKNDEFIPSHNKLELFAKYSDGTVASNPSKALTISNDGSFDPDEVVEYTLIAVDTFKFKTIDAAYCKEEYSVKVVMRSKSNIDPVNLEFCQGLPSPTDKLPTTSDGSYSFFADDAATTPVVIPAFSSLPSDDYTYYYTLTTADGCISEPAEFAVKVNPIPEFTVKPVEYEFCAGQTDIVLPTTAVDPVAGDVTIDWGGRETDLSKVRGAKDPYTFNYKVTSEEGCELDGQFVTVNAKLAVQIKVIETHVECGLTTLNVDIDPATASRTWTLDGTALDPTFKEKWEDAYVNGKLTLETSLEGYCPADTTISLITTVAPVVLETSPVSYVKKSQYANPVDLFTASGALTPTVSEGNEAGDLHLQFSKTFYITDNLNIDTTGAFGAPDAYPIPQASDINDTKLETQYYMVRVINTATGCASAPAMIRVDFFGAPVPNVVHGAYCKGTASKSLKEYASINYEADPTGAYTLHFYSDDTKNPASEVPETTVPSTSAAGKVSYWVTQSSADGGESEPVQIDIVTYDVMKPSVDPTEFHYCRNTTDVVTLSATSVSDLTTQFGFTGMQWSSDNGAIWGETPITPSTSTVGKFVYAVRQYYTITSTLEQCVGDSVGYIVYIEETTPPTGDLSVSYLYSEQENNGGYSPLNVKNTTVVNVESGYNYYYAQCDASGNLLPGKNWSSTVPTPENVAPLNGGSVSVYYAVYRDSVAGAGCPSEPSIIEVVISDSPMPKVRLANFCEGETVPDLSLFVDINSDFKPATDYELLWYGTNKPTLAEMASGSTSVDVFNNPASVVSNDIANKISYYVAQRDLSTGAIGAASELVITIYPKPVLKVVDPSAVCGVNVDLSSAVSMSNTPIRGASYTTTFFSDLAATDAIAASVAQSGTYYVQSSYPTIGASISNSVCASKVSPIEVTIDQLELKPALDSITCPNMAGTLEAEVVANTSSVSFDWTDATTTDVQTTDATGAAKSTYTTAPLLGVAGTPYQYDLKVTAGSCVKTYSSEFGKKLTITLGDGPVNGLLTFMENNNSVTGTPEAIFNGHGTDYKFYTCGNGVDVTADFDITEGSYSWTGPAFSQTSSKGDGVNLNGPGVYTITYVNKCKTSVTFEIVDASITGNLLTLSSGTLSAKETDANPQLTICENDPINFDLGFSVVNKKDFSITWTQGTDELSHFADKEKNAILSAEPIHSGKYAYTIKNAGCTATGYVDAVVRPFIKFTSDKYSYIARRDSALDIVTELKVPANGALPSTAQYEWKDQNGFTNFTGTTTLTYPVTEDKTFTLTIKDEDNYCPASTQVVVQMDGRLKLETELEESMCRGDNGIYLVIDTTQTGKLVKKGEYRLEIIETVGEIAHQLNAQMIMDDGKMKYEIHPTENASYKVTAYYRYDDQTASEVDKQMVTSSEEITVLQPIKIEVPKNLRVCAGDELDINLVSVTPEGAVTVNWIADNSITSGTTDTESITVAPEYDEEQGHNHKYTKYYNLVATMEGCKDKEAKVAVVVDEPITGVIADTTICEGFSVRLDVSNFQASTYSWTTKTVGNPLGSSSTLRVTPEVTTEYLVDMSRGECTAQEKITVNVHATPTIVDVDSLGYRSIQILYDESGDAAPYYFSVDNKEFVASSIFDSLSYNNHVAFIKDRYDCKDTLAFNIKAPQVKIPIWFSPNGDGDFDKWECEGLSVTYPEAEIKIFDRWGKELARFTGADGGWDGTYKGQDMPSTDYWYEIHVREIDKIYTGHFTLMRR